jgi:hypothetical protein
LGLLHRRRIENQACHSGVFFMPCVRLFFPFSLENSTDRHPHDRVFPERNPPVMGVVVVAPQSHRQTHICFPARDIPPFSITVNLLNRCPTSVCMVQTTIT